MSINNLAAIFMKTEYLMKSVIKENVRMNKTCFRHYLLSKVYKEMNVLCGMQNIFEIKCIS